MRRLWTLLLAVGMLLPASDALAATTAEKNEVSVASDSSWVGIPAVGADLASGGACFRHKAWRKGTSKLTGAELWRITLIAEWCVYVERDGSTHFRRVDWYRERTLGSQPYNSWKFRYWDDPIPGSGVVPYTDDPPVYYRYRRQGAFLEACLVKYGCIWQASPWVSMTVRSTGTWEYDTGG